MKRFLGRIGGATVLFSVPVMSVMAGGTGIANDPSAGAFGELLETIIDVINDILIPFILAIAFLAFVWGVFQYFIAGGANDEKKEKGKSLMIYAVAGFVLIIIFWGVVNLLATSTGLTDEEFNQGETPTVPFGGG